MLKATELQTTRLHSMRQVRDDLSARGDPPEGLRSFGCRRQAVGVQVEGVDAHDEIPDRAADIKQVDAVVVLQTEGDEHFMFQIITVQDTGRQVVKGPDMTDDLWRAVVLGSWALDNLDFKDFLSEKSRKTVFKNTGLWNFGRILPIF